jgi:hypothetical protein
MWKPVRLQGAGAASVTLNANTHPSGKMDPWRRQVECLFGLSLNGQPISSSNPYDSNNDPATQFVCPASMRFQVDRIPLEGIVGWDTTTNGNLAELLQEPTLMGAYEGAAITVLSKGVRYPAGSNPFGTANEGAFPNGTVMLTNNNADCTAFVGNFLCNPSRIDGLSITNSSQGGGGINVHGWAHYLEISNNRVFNNAGTLSGGINIGQGESPDAYIVGDPNSNPVPPVPVPPGTPNGTQLPYLFNTNVHVHNNSVTANASYGDELFSSTPAGAGGVTFCTGSDYYKFDHNWVCGNLSSGDGGGFAHLGFSYNGNIDHNSILFNQSTNPTVPSNGGGIVIMGAAPDGSPAGSAPGTECGSVTDVDCAPGLSDGTGPGLVINANLIMGNAAESGSGGGLRLQTVNGSEVARFPLLPARWYGATVTNNIIANNVAGWDGGGVSLQDALKVDFINNTIVSNDTTASSGVLFNTLGAPISSTPPPGCDPTSGTGCTNPVTTSTPQAAGLVTMRNTPNLTASLPGLILCPVGHSSGLGSLIPAPNGDCRQISYPLLQNDLFWQNRTFNISVGSYDQSKQQNLVTLLPTLNQPQTDSFSNGVVTGGAGACVSGANYWDIGVRGDTGPSNHGSSFTLSPMYSILTDASDYSNPLWHNLGSNPAVISQYCNGSRVPPENGGMSYQVPPGIADATVPNPIFNLMPAATVDEGNNWINISWGPLSMVNPSIMPGNPSYGIPLGNYGLCGGSGNPVSSCNTSSPAINQALAPVAPPTDFYGTPRPQGGGVDIGAVEFIAPNLASTSVTPTTLAFGNVVAGFSSAPQTLTLSNTGGANLTGISIAVTAPFSRPSGAAGGTCSATLNAGSNCSINVVFTPTSQGAATGSVTIAASVAVSGSPVALSGTGTAAPTKPTLAVLDNFNRANATTLGSNWTQGVVLGSAAIQVNSNQAFCATIPCFLGGNASWNVPSGGFGAKQAAAFTFVNTSVNNDALMLAGTGATTLGLRTNFVRVRYNAGQVIVETSTNTGVTYSAIGTLPGAFTNGDTITALIDPVTATVYVWKTTPANITTFIGPVQLPMNALWTGGGTIGMQMVAGARVDNFAGSTVP